MDNSKNHKMKQRTPGRWVLLQQPSLACASSCFQVPVCGGSRHAETRRPGGKWEHPTAAGSGLSSHAPNTHRYINRLPPFRNPQSTQHTNTRVLLENKSFMFLDQVTTVTSHLSVRPTLNKNWEISIDAGVCPYTKNFFCFVLFFFDLWH